MFMLKVETSQWDTNDILTKLLNSFLENYEYEENILRHGSNFIFDSVDFANIQFHIIELKRGKSYIPTPKWISDKKATTNPQNTNDNYCFAYSIIASLHHEDIYNHPERTKNLAPFIKNYNWNFLQNKRIGKGWRETTKTLFLTFFLPTLLMKTLTWYVNQTTIISVKT